MANQATENAEVSGKVYTKKDVIRGGIIGWGLGVVTTLLFAPKSGKELRGDISYQAGYVKDKAADKSKDLGNTAKDKYVEMKDSAINQSKRVKDKMSRDKKKQSDKETTDQENSENNSQLQSDRLEDAMGNEQEESGEKKRSDQSGSDSGNKSTTKKRKSSSA
jgi:gas vesicle protein